MMRLWRICWLSVLFSVGISFSSAHDFLIETRLSTSQEDLGGEERIRAIETESGVMDVLFENGHIFFNVYNSPDEQGLHRPVERTIALANETGADFLVELVLDEAGVAWRLRALVEPASVQRFYEPLSQVDKGLAGAERWTALGTILGGRMMDILPGG